MEAQVVIVDLGNRCKCAPREHGVSRRHVRDVIPRSNDW